MKHTLSIALLLLTALCGCSSNNSVNPKDGMSDKERAARIALEQLYSHAPGAKELATTAHGILVFPEITKAGFLIGGQYGNGVLFENGRVSGYYNTTAASYGLQAGVQQFGYALFFMTQADLKYLKNSEGWEVGVGPSIVVADKGLASSITTTTARKGVYAFFFEQKGLMAGLGIQGTKITRTGSAT